LLYQDLAKLADSSGNIYFVADRYPDSTTEILYKITASGSKE